MVDWMMPIYKWVGVPYPKTSLAVAIFLGALLFGGWWWLTGREYREQNQPAAKTEQAQNNPDGNVGMGVPGAGQARNSDNSGKSSTATKKSPSPTSDAEKLAIVMPLVQKYKDRNAGKLPTIAWLNDQLKEEGQTFLIEPPKTFTCVDCTFEGNGTAIENSSPNATFDLRSTKFINNQKGIVNKPPPEPKKEEPRPRPQF